MAAAKEKVYVTRYGNHKLAIPTEDGYKTVRFEGQFLRTSDRAEQKHIESLPDYGVSITEFAAPPAAAATTGDDGADQGE